MAKKVFSDFDNTIRNHDGTDILAQHERIKKHIANGDKVTIITRRHKDDTHSGFDGNDVENYVKEKLGDIPIIFDDSDLKWQTLMKENADKHYDDDPKEIRAINDNTDIEGVLVKDGKGVDFKPSEKKVDAPSAATKEKKDDDLSTKKALVIDFGTFLSVPHRLAKDFGKVYYYTPWQSGFPLYTDSMIGTGYPDIEHVLDFWHLINDVDLIYFPEVSYGEMQQFLVDKGYNVWGSRLAQKLEMDRYFWIETLKKLGLHAPDTRKVIGIDKLVKILKDEKDLYIKTNDKNRGQFETFHHVNWNTTRPLIEKITYELGPGKNDFDFIVQKPIAGKFEFGFDTWFDSSQKDPWAETLMEGYEIKELGYVCRIIKHTELPKEVLEILKKITPILKEYGYTGNLSAEFRKDEDNNWYFTDPCLRCANPATATMMTMCSNYSQVIMNKVKPEWKAKFGVEITINSEFLENNFGDLSIPDDVNKWVNRINSCIADGSEWNVPNGKRDSYGSLVAMGDDVDSMMKDLKQRADKIEGYKIEVGMDKINEAAEFLKKLK